MSKSEVDNLKEAEKVLWWYPQPNSLIDEGNLYFAAIEYQSAYQALQKENEELKKERDRYANAMKIALQEGIFFDKASVFNRITEALKKD